MVLTWRELGETPEDWAEELTFMEAGWDAAVAIVQKRERGKHAAPQEPQGKPIYGMPGVRMPDSRPDLRAVAPAEYPELR